MTKLNDILKSPNIPEDTKEMINSLYESGKEALNAYYDEDSDFYQHAQPKIIVKNFYANTAKISNIYHYTSVQSFQNIIMNRKVYLGSMHQMNDSQEMIYTFSLGKTELKKLGASESELQNFTLILDKIPLDIYIWSFSANDHSQSLLNYGDIALSFKSQDVMDELATHFSRGASSLADYKEGNAYVFPLRVEYSKRIQIQYIKPVIKEWLAAYRNLAKDPDDMNEILSDCVQAMYLFSLCFKNPVLSQEEEIRYVVIKINADNNIHPELIFNNKPAVSCELTSHMLNSVILSRKISMKYDDIKDFLIKNKFKKTAVLITKLPY